MFDNCNVNLRKNKGILTYIPYIPIPEYGQSNNSNYYTYYTLVYSKRLFYSIDLWCKLKG